MNTYLNLDFLKAWDWNTSIYLLVLLFLLFVARWAYHFSSSFSLTNELTQKDNKAVAVSFAGYVIATGLVQASILQVENYVPLAGKALLQDILEILLWGGIAIVFMLLARIVTNKLLLPRFDTRKELIEDRNVGVGAVEAGMFIGTAFILRASISGESTALLRDVGMAALYFVIGQLLLIVFAWLYQRMLSYSMQGEMEKDNEAAGLSFAGNLVAMGYMLGHFIHRSDSLLGLVIWFAMACFALFAGRYFTDTFLLPKATLDEEVARDRNWGTALLEVSFALILAIFITTAVGSL